MTRSIACGVEQYEILIDSANLNLPAGIIDQNPVCEQGYYVSGNTCALTTSGSQYSSIKSMKMADSENPVDILFSIFVKAKGGSQQWFPLPASGHSYYNLTSTCPTSLAPLISIMISDPYFATF